MGRPGRIQATRLADLEKIVGTRHVITVTAGPQNDLVVLSLADPPDYRETAPNGVSFAKPQADRPNHYRIDHFLGGDWRSCTLPPTKENFHSVQALGKDGWLLVRGRARGEVDRNAHVYSSDGTQTSSFHVGDAVEDVQVTERGDCWVSYFDEAPFEQGGLVCFDKNGRVVLRFNDLGTVPFMLDCYALNVCSNQEVWACYYTDFPLVRLVDCQVARIWPKVRVKGSHAFAVSGERVLFGGQYDKRHRLFLADLGTMRVKGKVPATDTGRVIHSFTAFGRGSRLYLHTGTEVFVVDLAGEED